MVKNMKYQLGKIALIILGSLAVFLGVLGIFIPLLPTTPFLLLAASCFIRSSARLHTWLLSNRWFGEYIKNYYEHRGIPRKTKIFAITILWLSIGSSILFFVSHTIIRILLLMIAVGVTIHLLHLTTLVKQIETDRREERMEDE